MNKIAIFTDSIADLSRDVKEAHHIISIPHYINFDSEIYQDGVNFIAEDLYKLVKEKKDFPKTTAATHEDFISLFESYLNFGYDILYIGVGSKFSLAYQNALMTREQVNPSRIYIVDSQNLSSGIGILVLKAVKMRQQRVSIGVIQQRLNKLVPRIKTQFVLKTNEYMIKDKMISPLMGLIGRIFKVKPLIHVENGELKLYKKSFGSLKKAIRVMLQELFESIIYLDTEYVLVTHSLANREVLFMISQIKKHLPNVEVVESTAGCVMSMHCGPGAVGLTYITI